MTPRRTAPRLGSRLLLVLVAVLAALAFPAAAQALKVEIVNESGREDDEVWIAVRGEAAGFDVPGFTNGVARQLSSVEPHELTINYVESGRIYVAYGKEGVNEFEADSPLRFGWVELSEEGKDGDVANLTAVDQFGIGMRLNTFGVAEEPLEELGSANADTIFAALQGIPGGPEATVRDADGNILRVLSPTHTGAYPDLGGYVRSMAGKAITLHSTFSGPNPGEFASSLYGGTFAADGSIVLTGTTTPAGRAPAQISFQGDQLIEDVYTGANTPNDLEGAIRHDVLVGFMAGYWDGRYGNDAIGLCTDPEHSAEFGAFCPAGFNQPAFGDARSSLSPFPTCEQYAAVINQYADMYGNPYSDGASGKVTIPINKSGVKDVGALQVTLLPDSGDSQPVTGGNAACGAAAATGGGGGSTAPTTTPSKRRNTGAGVRTRLFKRARLRRGRLRVARVACSGPCGRIRAVVRKGRRVLARALIKRAARKRLVVARLTRPGRRLLRRHPRLKARLDLWVAPRGRPAVHRRGKLLLVR